MVREQIGQTLTGAAVGSLTLVESGNQTTFGRPNSDGPHVRLTVLSEQFWVRLMLVQDLGFAEAYMAGEIAVSSLVDFIRFYIYNRTVLESASSSPMVSSLMYLASTRFGNSILNTASNISAHYDLGNEMFEMFLDSTMTYSCAIWSGPNETLEEAQLRKLDMLIDKAHVRKTDYILDLGCGWGSLAMRAVERTGCRVLGITLSAEQKEVAEQRIAQAGMSDCIKIMLIDYRRLDPAEYCFDKIISLEMVEHVGFEYLPVYFEQCSKLLHPQHGVMVLQASTMNEERYEQYRYTVDFINKHIFPGGHCPSVSALVAAATSGTTGTLMLESAANFPDHYARTLRVWRERFLCGYDKVANNAHESTAEFNDVFRRKWEYYFAYCEGAFATRTLGCTQLVFTRTYNEALSDKLLLS
ncbi:Mycolic acid cyclopropane synthetase-domain-containing protein [Coemansia spiralis]|nr:Mycolic acid cyclopropane synthetase-domain-containing protein [Coemansia spiralis]